MAEVHKCATCNVRLNVFEEDGKRTYTHAGQSTSSDPEFFNHKPVPVPEIEYDQPADTVCDFCSEPKPTWRHPCRPAENALMVFEHQETGDTKVVDYRDNNPDWYACDSCHDMVERGDANGLVVRSMTRMLQVGRIHYTQIDEVVPQVQFMHALFFKNRFGSSEQLPN